jgi:hypothetical protein
LLAWTNALQIARDDNEREGVYIHIARIEVAAGRFADAQAQLDVVTNTAFFELRNRIQRNLAERENPPANQTPAIVSTNVPAATNNFAPAPANIVATTNAAGVSTDLMTAPPHLRGQ